MTSSGAPPLGWLRSQSTSINISDLAQRSIFGERLDELRGRTVLLIAREQLFAALALIELDGVASRIVLCPPDLASPHFTSVAAEAGADALVRDEYASITNNLGIGMVFSASSVLMPSRVERRCTHVTEWVLLTSGTSGAPKLVLHSLASLTSAIAARSQSPDKNVWSTFYDIRRYGGLQILLRGLFGGSVMFSSATESTVDFLVRAGAAGVTHISGTPSHWRKALMSGAAARIAPRNVRLSGEIADQGILDGLRAAYPDACITHAFASTEAGVAFEVSDCQAGFPLNLIGDSASAVNLKVDGGTLRIRSAGTAMQYLGDAIPALKGDDGFVDTGDRLELRNGRYYFMGRIGGIVNVGGLKVHPEEVEAVINSHPWVQMSLVKARRSPITGAVVMAEVVLIDDSLRPQKRPGDEAITKDIIDICRRELAQHKVPAVIRIVPALDVSAAGKLVRPNA